MRRKAETGIMLAGGFFAFIFVILIIRYFLLVSDSRYARMAGQQSTLTITVDGSEGNIYDRNMTLLVNNSTALKAVAVPQPADYDTLYEKAEDKELFSELYAEGAPFVFDCHTKAEESEAVTVFRVPVRYGINQIAQHVIGYTSQGKGVAGIEYAYDSILRSKNSENSVSYTVDGFGRVLIGDGKEVKRSGIVCGGVVITIDSAIQRICENSCEGKIEKGAVIVADISTGDILALASFPDYSVYELEKAIKSEDSPLINRALYSYSTGSAFKLVTACEALKEGLGDYKYECTGSVDINGKIFNCHNRDGHGIQNMTQAMVNSCNTYFISLSRIISLSELRNTAFSLGFGREIHLCSGMTASAGVLPTAEELMIPAELANFSFGQGKLTSTPLQVLQMTCAIANGGKMPVLRIIKGISEDGVTVTNEKAPQLAYTMEEETAHQLAQMMISAVEESESSNAKSDKVKSGAKTSTAQTGRFDENGEELCNGWITGFFPAESPEYAVTVLAEDGGYGNEASAPLFRDIAEKITKLEENH